MSLTPNSVEVKIQSLRNDIARLKEEINNLPPVSLPQHYIRISQNKLGDVIPSCQTNALNNLKRNFLEVLLRRAEIQLNVMLAQESLNSINMNSESAEEH